jgi:hypothetical protein
VEQRGTGDDLAVLVIPIRSTLVQLYAQRFVESNMTATVRVTRPGDAGFDAVTGELTADSGPTVYEGRGRVYSASGPATLDLGDGPQYFSSGFVSVPMVDESGDNVLPQVNDLIEVLEHPDPLMLGRRFRVMDVEAGGQFAVVRRMQVMGIQRSRTWTPDSQAEEAVIPREWMVG